VLLALSVSTLRAQPYITPFVGFNFGGDAGCRNASDCDDRTSNLGVAIGSSNVLLGFEEELAYAKHFFGDDPLQSGNVFTAMTNVVVGPRVGPVHPYGVIGAGIIKTRVELTFTDLATSNTSFGWNVGGGLELGGAHVGVRGDVRYFHAFDDVSFPGLPLANITLDFGRASAGVVFRF
jgi:opacity protein-like surface antigen